jgi:osmoprotectant transport system permease protein
MTNAQMTKREYERQCAVGGGPAATAALYWRQSTPDRLPSAVYALVWSLVIRASNLIRHSNFIIRISQSLRPPPTAYRPPSYFIIRVSPIIPFLFLTALAGFGCSRKVTVASKVDTESVILGNMAAELSRGAGADVVERAQLGGTQLVWKALIDGQVDIYPEYTGTLSHEIFAGQNIRGEAQIRRSLKERGIEMTQPLGFNNSYALGMREDVAQRLGITTVSDLRKQPALRLGFSNEFMDRKDGWPGMRDAYRLSSQNIRGLDHDLAYRALASDAIDVTDLYTTDAEIAAQHLRVLDDDLHYFPEYRAVFLYRADLRERAPDVVAALKRLEGRITQQKMIQMNADAKIHKVPEARVAADFLAGVLNMTGDFDAAGFWHRLAARTWEHVQLVGVSLLAAILIAIPLGVAASAMPRLGQVILGIVAGIYTIPSLALLVFMLPLLGIGWKPAVMALFLYSLLPIVRNTHAGLAAIPEPLRESARALGLPRLTRLLWIELPLASVAILAGIQTSAVLNIGTATLGALIGAGGYGQPIITGIRLNNLSLILEGAIPAALMALLAQAGLDLAGRSVIPRGLRLDGRGERRG